MLKVKQYSQETTDKTISCNCAMSRDKLVAIPDADNVVSQLVKSQNSEKKKSVTGKQLNCIMLFDGNNMTPCVEMKGHVVR